MAVINIKTLSKVLSNSATGRKMFKFGVRVVLHALEAHRLIDWRKLEEVSLDWEKGTLNLGDGFLEMLTGRAINEYIWDVRSKKANRRDMANVANEISRSVTKHLQ
jgi:hypothetical protein